MIKYVRQPRIQCVQRCFSPVPRSHWLKIGWVCIIDAFSNANLMKQSLRLLLFLCAFWVNILFSSAQQHSPDSGLASQHDVVTGGETVLTSNPPSYACDETFTLSTPVYPSVGGTVTGAGTYTAGTALTFTALPAEGYRFTGWSGDAEGTSNRITVTLNANKTVTANFQELASAHTHTTASIPPADRLDPDAGSSDASSRKILLARVYPNPAKDVATMTVTLEEKEQATVVLSDAQGNTVDSFTIHPSADGMQRVPYSVAGKKPGVYTLVIVSTSGRRFATKLVVE